VAQAREAAGLADPFASQRGQYQDLLKTAMGQYTDLLTNPGSFSLNPGEQFAEKQGLEGVARHGNAMFGTTRAGGTAIGLDKYATGFAEQAYDTRVKQFGDRVNMLMNPAGVNAGSPAAAGLLLERGFDNQNKTTGSAVSGLGGGIGGILNSLFGKGGPLAGAPQAIQNMIRSALGGGTIDETNNEGAGSIVDTDGGTPTPDGYGGITTDDLRRAGFSDQQISDFFGGGPPVDAGGGGLPADFTSPDIDIGPGG
jgi:hypothetical protein